MYSIKEAAARSGVTVPTLRAWERRYGVVSPVRTPSGYRLYDEEAIKRLRLMRRLLDDGWRAREAAAEVVSGRAQELTLQSPPPPDEVVSPERLVDELVAAVSPFDSATIDAVLDETFARARYEAAMEEVVFPALREIGRRWETGAISVAAEHAASHHVLRRLAMLFEAAARPQASHDVVLGLPPHARHDLGALAFGVAVRRLGIGVLYLGADVPIDSWLAALRETGARAAVIAVPTGADAVSAAEVVAAGRAAMREVAWFTGGFGAEHDSLARADATRLPNGIGESSRRLSEALAGGPTAA